MTHAASVLWSCGLNAVAAWLGHRIGTVSRSGAIGGAVIGAVIYATAGPGAWILLLATFGAAVVASRVRLSEKVRLGIAQESGGRRGIVHAAANCGVAVVAAAAVVITPFGREALVALVTALVAAGSDTVASEIGKGCGGSPVLVTTFGRVPPGTPGAMSLTGTIAGLAAASALAGLAWILGLMPWPLALPVVTGATTGSLVESLLAASFESRGFLTNESLNVINTAVAVVVALELA